MKARSILSLYVYLLAGDAFAGGLLHSLAREFTPQMTIDFSITASVLKLMIQHDFNVGE